METTKLIWKEAATASNGNSEELGRAYKEFADCQYFFPPTKENKKAVVMFKNKDNKVITVIMQNAVSDAFKAGKITKDQALTLPVIKMEKIYEIITNPDGTKTQGAVKVDEPTFWLGRPNQGWQDVQKDLTEISDWENLTV